MGSITPYLRYEDLGAMMAWLEEAFGLKTRGPALNGPDGAPSHAEMQMGEGIVLMGRPDPRMGYRNPKRLGGTTQSLYVMVDDVERHFERAREAGVRILEALTDTEYGHRRYGAVDPEGHEWYFAQARRS